MTANLMAATSLTPGVQFSGQLGSTAETTVFTCPASSSLKVQSWTLCNINPAALITPTISSTSTATTGGSLAPQTRAFRVAATNALGQTLASQEVTIVIPAGTSTNTATVNWAAVPGATGYSVYAGAAAAAELLLAAAGNVLTYLDTGAITPAGALPTANTTGGAVSINASVLQTGQATGTAGHRVISGYNLNPGDTVDLVGLCGAPMLGPGDFLTVTAGMANAVNVVVTGAVGS